MLTVLFMLFVSLGYSSGGVRFDYGTHQLVCHCHHMVTEHLNFSGPTLLKLNTRKKKRKNVPKNLNMGSNGCQTASPQTDYSW